MDAYTFLDKMITNHLWFSIWVTLVPIICCTCFGVAAAEKEWEDCDSENCTNYRKAEKEKEK